MVAKQNVDFRDGITTAQPTIHTRFKLTLKQLKKEDRISYDRFLRFPGNVFHEGEEFCVYDRLSGKPLLNLLSQDGTYT